MFSSISFHFSIIFCGRAQFEETEYQNLLAEMCACHAQKVKGSKETTDDGGKGVSDGNIDYVSGKKIAVAFNKPWLGNEMDVDQYLFELKKALMKEIDAGKRIQI